MTNTLALVCAAVVGFLATDVVVYYLGIAVGAERVGPLFRGVVATIVVAFISPRASFKARFYAYATIYLTDLALSVVGTAIAVFMIQHYLAGDHEAAKPWVYAGALIPFIAGAVGYFMIRRLVSSQTA